MAKAAGSPLISLVEVLQQVEGLNSGLLWAIFGGVLAGDSTVLVWALDLVVERVLGVYGIGKLHLLVIAKSTVVACGMFLAGQRVVVVTVDCTIHLGKTRRIMVVDLCRGRQNGQAWQHSSVVAEEGKDRSSL